MPDFKAIGDLLGNIKSALDGVLGLTGSLAGGGIDNVLGQFESFSAAAE